MIYSFDTETFLIQPGLLAPRLVCVQIATAETVALFGAAAGLTQAHLLLRDPQVILAGANIAYDFGVLCAADESLIPLVFEAYRAGRIRDVQIRQQLLDLAAGSFREHFNQTQTRERPVGYSLADLSLRWLGRVVDKGDDTWRLRYSELVDVPIEQWPEAARMYALTDARVTFDVLKAQNDSLEAAIEESIVDECDQVHSAWVLHLMSVWGIRTNPERIQALETRLRRKVDRVLNVLTHRGLYRWKGTKKQPRRDGISKDTKQVESRVEEMLGQSTPRTPTLRACTDEETLLLAAGEGLTREEPEVRKWAKELRALARVAGDQKLLSAFIPKLWDGTQVPINARFRVLVSSGRTSCAGPNLQQLPKKPGVRECFYPRPGFVFVSCDYDVFELRTLAQCLLWMCGKSAMAEQLQAGRELHLAFAAQLLRRDYDEVLAAWKESKKKDPEIKEARNLAKVANFGLPGGLGAERFVDFAKSSGVILTQSEAQRLKDRWLETFPEMRKYFRIVGDLVGDDVGELKQFVSNRVRGGVGYTDGCNSFFQGLAADAAKAACRQAAYEAYVDRKSPFFGSRPVAFIHDEIIPEVPRTRAHEAATRLGEIMCEAARPYLPDIPVTASPTLMAVWSKEAEELRDSDGRLLVWTPAIAA